MMKNVRWPPSVSLVAGPDNQVCMLALGNDGQYDSLVFLDSEGETKKTVSIQGNEVAEVLPAARLLGFSDDGSAVVFGWSLDEPGKAKSMVFSIDSTGNVTVLDTLSYPPLFAIRYGSVEKKSLWLNVSSFFEKKITFHQYQLK